MIPSPNHLHNVTVWKQATDHSMFVDIDKFDGQNISSFFYCRGSVGFYLRVQFELIVVRKTASKD